ncbi:GspE/PulE family protein [Clostridium hydrogeniformans]|uniref:GspE/PulE family protein n=1 Tax=Clostridium hydrogeniformans TaxID=349933 RepID=UPI00068D8F71|nr:GspE/PulE family protein [Clostridium hydrogeniformans]
MDIDINLINVIPRKFVLENLVIPVSTKGETINFLCGENFDDTFKAYLKFIYRKEVFLTRVKDEKVKKLIFKYYGDTHISSEIFKKEEEDKGSNSTYIDFVENLIKKGIEDNASDIHIEPFNKEARIRLRVYGILEEDRVIPLKEYEGVISRIKILSSMDIAEKRKFQEGKIRFLYKDKNYDLRTSIIPTVNGEKVVIRILKKGEDIKNLEDINYGEKVNRPLKNMLKNQGGIILVTGPTGSGKTTSLYAMLNYLNEGKINITTIEDPVEYTLKGVNQVNINNSLGINFSNSLRVTLRQDPDVIMVGEIRDEETAKIAVRAAITGHLVLSTLHTNNALGAFNRLEDMGVPKYLLYDSIKVILSQRLVKTLCPYCKEEIYLKNEEKNIYKSFQSRGCTKCSFKGIGGRVLLSEAMVINRKDKSMTFLTNLEENIRESISKGIISREEGMRYLSI